jgi:hypothetical protein
VRVGYVFLDGYKPTKHLSSFQSRICQPGTEVFCVFVRLLYRHIIATTCRLADRLQTPARRRHTSSSTRAKSPESARQWLFSSSSSAGESSGRAQLVVLPAIKAFADRLRRRTDERTSGCGCDTSHGQRQRWIYARALSDVGGRGCPLHCTCSRRERGFYFLFFAVLTTLFH